MSPEQQRICIAKACGWTFQPMMGPLDFPWMTPSKKWEDRQANPPDYLSDLNAMHEAEKVIRSDKKKWNIYYCHLCKMNGGFRNCMHATAAQRAEAFLRATGKWEEA